MTPDAPTAAIEPSPAGDLAHRRPLILASLFFGIGWMVVRTLAWPDLALAGFKAGAVACLAAYALRRHHDGDFRLLGAALALCAVGDAGVEFDWIAGGLFFAGGHLLYMALFLRNRRRSLSPSQAVLAAVLLVAPAVTGWYLPADRAMAPLIALYGLLLGASVALAWTSRFSRYRTGLGAVLFLLSDLLIFATFGPLADVPLAVALVWPLYYSGQLLIAIGTVGVLRRRAAISRF